MPSTICPPADIQHSDDAMSYSHRVIVALCHPWSVVRAMSQTQPFRNLSPDLPLGQILLALGLLAPDQLDHARREQDRLGVRLGETLVGLGYVSAGQVAQAVAYQR